MKVSVIVPVYNGEAYLAECLDSILAQTYSDMEIVVVDDGSTDGSGSMADNYAETDSRVRVLHCTNGGLSVARNRGIDVATGDYVCFVDADDVLHPFMLSTLCSIALETGAEVCSCGFLRSGCFKRNPEGELAVFDGVKAVEKILYQDDDVTMAAWAHLFDRRLFDSGLRFRKGILYEDLELLHQLYFMADKVAHTSARLYYYRDTPGSIINTWSERRLDVLDVTEGIEQAYKEMPRLLAAARDRRMSAAFNILLLNARHGHDRDLERRCMAIIRERRLSSLLNRRVRLKNKLGILLSYIGKRALYVIARV